MTISKARARAVAAGVVAAVAVCIGVVALSKAAILFGYRVNLTPSIPRGLYRASAPQVLHRGDLVSVCLVGAAENLAAARGYAPRIGGGSCAGGALPVFKMVVAIGGDVVDVARAGVLVNGRLVRGSAPLDRDSAGRPLVAVKGPLALGRGQVWLYGENPLSFDSRYFGAVDGVQVLARLEPVATEGR